MPEAMRARKSGKVKSKDLRDGLLGVSIKLQEMANGLLVNKLGKLNWQTNSGELLYLTWSGESKMDQQVRDENC